MQALHRGAVRDRSTCHVAPVWINEWSEGAAGCYLVGLGSVCPGWAAASSEAAVYFQQLTLELTLHNTDPEIPELESDDPIVGDFYTLWAEKRILMVELVQNGRYWQQRWVSRFIYFLFVVLIRARNGLQVRVEEKSVHMIGWFLFTLRLILDKISRLFFSGFLELNRKKYWDHSWF